MNDKIDVEDLKEYRWRIKEIQSINAELKTIYYAVESPSGKTDGTSRSSTPSDPTSAAYKKADALRARKDRLQSRINAVNYWIIEQRSSAVATVCRYHYIMGLTWKKTTDKISTEFSEDSSRKIAERYFKTSDV